MPGRNGEALVRRYFEAVNNVGGAQPDAALGIVDDVTADDFVMAYNNDADADAMRGRDRHKDFLVEHAHDVVDDRWTIETLVEGDDIVACIWRTRGRHAETGKPLDVRGADFFTVRGGRLAELRRFMDFESAEEQVRETPAR